MNLTLIEEWARPLKIVPGLPPLSWTRDQCTICLNNGNLYDCKQCHRGACRSCWTQYFQTCKEHVTCMFCRQTMTCYHVAQTLGCSYAKNRYYKLRAPHYWRQAQNRLPVLSERISRAYIQHHYDRITKIVDTISRRANADRQPGQLRHYISKSLHYLCPHLEKIPDPQLQGLLRQLVREVYVDQSQSEDRLWDLMHRTAQLLISIRRATGMSTTVDCSYIALCPTQGCTARITDNNRCANSHPVCSLCHQPYQQDYQQHTCLSQDLETVALLKKTTKTVPAVRHLLIN